jgi:lantibiotic biosynthesis protein
MRQHLRDAVWPHLPDSLPQDGMPSLPIPDRSLHPRGELPVTPGDPRGLELIEQRWPAVLPWELAGRVLTVTGEVAELLRDRRHVEAASTAALQQTAFPIVARWQPASLAHGDAGLAAACAYLDACFPGEGWDRTGHGYLTLAAEDAEQAAWPAPGLWGGLAGLGFAAWSLSRGGTRYQRLLGSVDEALLPQVAAQAGRVLSAADGMTTGEFDVISGLAGVGAYLLCRRERDAAGAALDITLRALVALVGETAGRPRWWTPPTLMGNEGMAAQYPHGNLNCGLAHGLPGPLATMSLALLSGVTVPGLGEAVEGAASWLAAHGTLAGWGMDWPVAVPLTASGEVVPGETGPPNRSGWCYGAPGVARALWLAGRAADRAGWRQLAVEAMLAAFRRPAAARLIDSPTFCHGVSGLLQITLRFARDTGLSAFADAAAELTGQLLDLYEPDSLTGYRNIEPGDRRVDNPGLLDGAPGVVMAMLAAATEQEPVWDRAFLLG